MPFLPWVVKKRCKGVFLIWGGHAHVGRNHSKKRKGTLTPLRMHVCMHVLVPKIRSAACFFLLGSLLHLVRYTLFGKVSIFLFFSGELWLGLGMSCIGSFAPGSWVDWYMHLLLAAVAEVPYWSRVRNGYITLHTQHTAAAIPTITPAMELAVCWASFPCGNDRNTHVISSDPSSHGSKSSRPFTMAVTFPAAFSSGRRARTRPRPANKRLPPSLHSPDVYAFDHQVSSSSTRLHLSPSPYPFPSK